MCPGCTQCMYVDRTRCLRRGNLFFISWDAPLKGKLLFYQHFSLWVGKAISLNCIRTHVQDPLALTAHPIWGILLHGRFKEAITQKSVVNQCGRTCIIVLGRTHGTVASYLPLFTLLCYFWFELEVTCSTVSVFCSA